VLDVPISTGNPSPTTVSISTAYSKRPRVGGGRVWEAPFLPPKSEGNRHFRRALARKRNPSRKILEDFNDKQVGRYLHATKGWRYVSVRRSTASMIVAALTNNHRLYRSDYGFISGLGR